jgi:hypothetical protein
MYFRQTSIQNSPKEVLQAKLQISHLMIMGKNLLLEKTIFMNAVSVAEVRDGHVLYGKLY